MLVKGTDELLYLIKSKGQVVIIFIIRNYV